jgi:hypothetical protein
MTGLQDILAGNVISKGADMASKWVTSVTIWRFNLHGMSEAVPSTPEFQLIPTPHVFEPWQ